MSGWPTLPGETPIDDVSGLKIRAVQIHPFLNGNGRWARMLANVWCKLQDGRVINWPEDVIGTQSSIRADYLSAIKAADRADYAALPEMHERYMK